MISYVHSIYSEVSPCKAHVLATLWFCSAGNSPLVDPQEGHSSSFELNSSGTGEEGAQNDIWLGFRRTEALDSSRSSTLTSLVATRKWLYLSDPVCPLVCGYVVIHSSWGCGLWQGLRDRLLGRSSRSTSVHWSGPRCSQITLRIIIIIIPHQGQVSTQPNQ